jgi:hypothetical protein
MSECKKVAENRAACTTIRKHYFLVVLKKNGKEGGYAKNETSAEELSPTIY